MLSQMPLFGPIMLATIERVGAVAILIRLLPKFWKDKNGFSANLVINSHHHLRRMKLHLLGLSPYDVVLDYTNFLFASYSLYVALKQHL